MKDIVGKEAKNKRRIAIAILLLALMFVAVMVWPKHDEPKVVGNLSKEEVAHITKTFFEGVDHEFRNIVRAHLQARAIGLLIEDLRVYHSIKILAIEAGDVGNARLTVEGRNPTDSVMGFCYKKDQGSWICVKIETGFVSDWLHSTNNTASVSRSVWP